jgi:Rrf2 family cysteine metabolism transcriptional repressor
LVRYVFALSVRSTYGLLAIVELGMRYRSGPVKIRTIADAHGISRKYLEQLLPVLRKGGLIKSVRGTSGGYMLARSPANISVFDVLSSLEGNIDVVKERNGDLGFFWDRVEKHIEGVLSISIEDLIEERQSRGNGLMFHI